MTTPYSEYMARQLEVYSKNPEGLRYSGCIDVAVDDITRDQEKELVRQLKAAGVECQVINNLSNPILIGIESEKYAGYSILGCVTRSLFGKDPSEVDRSVARVSIYAMKYGLQNYSVKENSVYIEFMLHLANNPFCNWEDAITQVNSVYPGIYRSDVEKVGDRIRREVAEAE